MRPAGRLRQPASYQQSVQVRPAPHEVLKQAFEKSSPKAIASDLGVSLSLVYKWAQEQSESGSGSRNPLDRILEIHDHTGHAQIIEWLCEQCGGYFGYSLVAASLILLVVWFSRRTLENLKPHAYSSLPSFCGKLEHYLPFSSASVSGRLNYLDSLLQ